MKLKLLFGFFVLSFVLACSSDNGSSAAPKPDNMILTYVEGTDNIQVNWEATVADNSTLTYDVYIDNKQVLSNTKDTYYRFQNLQPNTTYSIKVVFKSSNGQQNETIAPITTKP